jgi:3-phosphoshikimate 1-carboxyvinyltransferase
MLGIEVQQKNCKSRIKVEGNFNPEPREYLIPGDVSSAAFLLVAALITNNSEIIIPNVGLNSTRISYLDILKSIGANIEIEEVKIIGGEQMGTIRARSSQLEGNVHLDGHQIAGLVDEIPILAVAGAFCNGTFSVRDAEELRTKESDRVKTIVTNLRRMGVEVEEYNDGFAFESKKDLISGCFDSFNDHRIAMAFGVAALALKENSIIQNAGCVEISYPGFWQTVESF